MHAIRVARASETKLRRFARKESVRNLNQQARAIAGFRIAAACAAMR